MLDWVADIGGLSSAMTAVFFLFLKLVKFQAVDFYLISRLYTRTQLDSGKTSDDEEPELVIEESENDIEAEENVERLAASGISVTVIEKNKKQQTKPETTAENKDLQQNLDNSTAQKSKESIGLSSDISVTVVHKKKIDVGGISSGPKISVKKESELMVST